MTYSKIIAKRILELIDVRHGVSINRVAEQVGIEPATINKILNNQVGNPSIGTLVYIAKAFAIPVSLLLDIKELDQLTIEEIKKMNGRQRQSTEGKN